MNIDLAKKLQKQEEKYSKKPSQPCAKCGFPIGIVSGSKEAICINCGFKDPCCE